MGWFIAQLLEPHVDTVSPCLCLHGGHDTSDFQIFEQIWCFSFTHMFSVFVSVETETLSLIAW